MTQQQAQTIEQALARAAKENIRIVGKGTLTATGARFFIVSSKNYATTGRAYIVSIGEQLSCNCQASGICKHRAMVHQTLKDERQAETPASAPEQAMAAQTCPRCHMALCAENACHACGYVQVCEHPQNGVLPGFQGVGCKHAEQAMAEHPDPDAFYAEQQEALAEQLGDPWTGERLQAARMQAERSAKREAAILDTSPTFSGIFR
jgi:hypothetical protein